MKKNIFFSCLLFFFLFQIQNLKAQKAKTVTTTGTAQVEFPDNKSKLEVANVTVVHGDFKSAEKPTLENSNSEWREKEMNGAKALFHQELLPNAVIKLHKILDKYSTVQDCGETWFYLAQTLATLDKPGQAIDAFQNSIAAGKDCNDAETKKRLEAAKSAIKNLE